MPKQYTREELWKLYQKLPKELQEVIFAEETADHIGSICERYNIKEEEISEIAKEVGNVLLGVLPPDEFQKTLENEVNIEKEVVKKVAQEVNRFIFYPVKSALEQLYKMETVPTEEAILSKRTLEKPSKQEKIEKERPPAPSGPDAYRELIE